MGKNKKRNAKKATQDTKTEQAPLEQNTELPSNSEPVHIEPI